LGWYRFAVYGHTATADTDGYPYDRTTYALASDPFEVTPAEISIEVSEGLLRAWIAGPEWGYRLIDMEGNSRGANPVRSATIRWRLADWSTLEEFASAEVVDGAGHFSLEAPAGAIGVTVEDDYGNLGTHYFDSER
jgi:hypothetical protein